MNTARPESRGAPFLYAVFLSYFYDAMFSI